VEGLLVESYAENRRKLIDPGEGRCYPRGRPCARAGFIPALFAGSAQAFPDDTRRSADTTSFSIVDQYGMPFLATSDIGGGLGQASGGKHRTAANNGMRLGSTSP